MSGPIEKMSVAELESRIRFHKSTADAFAARAENSTAREFRQMAAIYQTELSSRLEERWS